MYITNIYMYTATDTTTMVITTTPSETGLSVPSNVIQPTSTDRPQIITETSTMTSAEGSTTISNTPTVANNSEPGRYVGRYIMYIAI